HPALHRVAVEVLTRVQSDVLADVTLNLSAHEVRHEHLIFKRPHLQAHFLVEHPAKLAGHFRNHAFLTRAASRRSSDKAPPPMHPRRRADRATWPGSTRAEWCAALVPWTLVRCR